MEDTSNLQLTEFKKSRNASCGSSRVDLMEVEVNIEEEVDNDEEFERLLWSIDDDPFFYPLGFTNHGTNAGKTVYVTWCEDYLLNFVFKRSQRTKRINLTKVRLPMPAGELVSDILILEMNALLLMHSGHVYYFSSVKSMHSVSWLSGVRCMALAPSGFSVVRFVADNNCLFLEMYRDVPDIGKNAPTLIQRSDITFDTNNFFNCNWSDERFTLVTQIITEDNLAFLQLLVSNEVTLVTQQYLHIFTVSGIVFALISSASPVCSENKNDMENVEYSIQQLCSFATIVDFIHIDCEEKRCLVFLQSGSIDIWYVSSRSSLLQRKQHHSGSVYTHRVYAANTRCFYFTDEEQVAQLQFWHNSELDTCHIQETFKAIPGIMACTWVETLQQLICLSCNNIFYKINFEKVKLTGANTAINDPTEYENLNVLYELTPARMSRLLSRAEVFNEIEALPEHLHAAIEQEFVKQQLIAVAHNQHIYRKIVKASLSFTTQLPSTFQQTFLLIYANTNFCLHNDSIMALIHLRISKNEVFLAEGIIWHLHIDYKGSPSLPSHHYNSQSQLMHIPSTLLQQELCIVLPLSRSGLQLLPNFNLKMYAVVRQESEFLAVTIPIELQVNAHTYKELFTCYKRCITIRNELDVPQLVKQFSQQLSKNVIKPSTATNIMHSLKLQQSCHFKDISEVFGIGCATANKEFTIYFMSNAVDIIYVDTEHYITLSSRDIFAIYYAKLHLFLCGLCGHNQMNDEAQLLILHLNSDLDRISASILQTNHYDDNDHTFQLELLKKIYTKLRNEFYTLFS